MGLISTLIMTKSIDMNESLEGENVGEKKEVDNWGFSVISQG